MSASITARRSSGEAHRCLLVCRILAIALVASAAQSGFASIVAGPLTNPANGHAYYLLDRSSWLDAEIEAWGMGGHLVTINDGAEQSWVYSTFMFYGGTNHGGLWNGLNDREHEGQFAWVSGEPVTYTAWHAGEPNSGGSGNEDCVVMHWMWSGGWGDLDNNGGYGGWPTEPAYGVVEVVPEPAMGAVLAFFLLLRPAWRRRGAN